MSLCYFTSYLFSYFLFYYSSLELPYLISFFNKELKYYPISHLFIYRLPPQKAEYTRTQTHKRTHTLKKKRKISTLCTIENNPSAPRFDLGTSLVIMHVLVMRAYRTINFLLFLLKIKSKSRSLLIKC